MTGLPLRTTTTGSGGRSFGSWWNSTSRGEVIIIPGWEIEIRPPHSPFDEYQVSELFLPGGGVFRIYCHPGYYSPNIIIEENVHAIEIDNHLHNWHIRPVQVQETADAYG